MFAETVAEDNKLTITKFVNWMDSNLSPIYRIILKSSDINTEIASSVRIRLIIAPKSITQNLSTPSTCQCHPRFVSQTGDQNLSPEEESHD